MKPSPEPADGATPPDATIGTPPRRGFGVVGGDVGRHPGHLAGPSRHLAGQSGR